MRFDQYQSEEKAYKQAIIDAIKGREDELMTLFIQKGPDELKKLLKIRRESDWNVIFDHLVFAKDLLKRCVLQFEVFFQNLVREKGPQAFRAVLGIQAAMYDQVFEKLFDLIAISKGSLFDYIYENRTEFVQKVKAGKGCFLRKELYLEGKKYDRTWQEILELLWKSAGEQLISERILQQGFKSFNLLMNSLRVQRGLRTYKF